MHRGKSQRCVAWRDSSHSRVRNSRAVVSQNDAQVVAIIGWPCTLFYGPRRANELSWSRSSGYRPGENFFVPSSSSSSSSHSPRSFLLSILLPSLLLFKRARFCCPVHTTYVRVYYDDASDHVDYWRSDGTCLIKVQWRLQGSRDGAENH